MFGFDINGLATLNVPVYVLAGFIVGLVTQLVVTALSTKAKFSPLRFAVAPAFVIAFFSWRLADPGWFAAMASGVGVFIAWCAIAFTRDRSIPMWLSRATVFGMLACVIAMQFWLTNVIHGYVLQVSDGRSAVLKQYANLGEVESFVVEVYSPCVEMPVRAGFFTVAFQNKTNCLASAVQLAREKQGGPFAKLVLFQAEQGLAQYLSTHPIQFSSDVKRALDESGS